jgi:ribonuclease P protein component
MRSNGRRLVHGCLIINWRASVSGHSRLGVVTSGKIGDAVVRSRARRLLRESFRVHQHHFERAVDIILVARQSIVGMSFHQVEVDFLTSLRKAGLLKERTQISG